MSYQMNGEFFEGINMFFCWLCILRDSILNQQLITLVICNLKIVWCFCGLMFRLVYLRFIFLSKILYPQKKNCILYCAKNL